MSQTHSGWWSDKKFPKLGDTHFDPSWAALALCQDALTDGRTVYDASTEGVLIGTLQQVLAKIVALGGRRIFEAPALRTDPSMRVYYVWKDSLMGVYSGDGDLEIRVVTTNEKVLEAAKALFEEHIGPKASAGRVYVLINTDEGPKLTSIGVASVPLERGNYNPDVVEDFDAVVADLKSKDPSGRLAIFDGKPGTGKTYMVRGLLASVPDALFVVVPAHLIPELANPGMINALLETRRNKGELPTVFIVEDADDCLGSRDSSNVNAVSALLNLGDGILGAMMDIRLVCTTNLKNEELDEAVVRPGRLSRKVHVGTLNPPVAEDLYKRLTDKDRRIRENLTLAEVYSLARDDGWKPVARSGRVMGFAAEVDRMKLSEKADLKDMGIKIIGDDFPTPDSL